MADKKEIFMKNLKKFRKLKGLSQRDLAEKCNLTKRIISCYETKAVNPPIDKLEKIANALEIPISDLFNEKFSFKKTQSEDIDPRIIKKLNKIKSLPLKEQNKIWDFANALLQVHDLKNQTKLSGK